MIIIEIVIIIIIIIDEMILIMMMILFLVPKAQAVKFGVIFSGKAIRIGQANNVSSFKNGYI